MLFRSITHPTLLAGLCLAVLGTGAPGISQAAEQHPDAVRRGAQTVSQAAADTETVFGKTWPPIRLASAAEGDAPPGASAEQAAESPPPLAQLGAFGWRDSHDQPFDVERLKGKPVVINFWATWCAPCVKEMPDLSALSGEIGEAAAFIGISLDKLDKVRRFTDRTPVAYPLLIADFKGLGLARQWGNKQGQMPYTVVLNAKGELHWQHAGIVNVDDLRSMLKSSELR
ncbi:MAG: TlpA disulfide reductase family protein [Lautropia sp.]|nr:TlpA disulfide reductase family protein [Lautropia sp.]